MKSQTSQQQMMMQKDANACMNMKPQCCYTTMYVFGFLVIVGLATQIIFQSKMLKELRKLIRKS